MLSREKTGFNNNIVWMIFIFAGIFLFGFLMSVLYKILPINFGGLKFSAFLILGLFIPGYAVLCLLKIIVRSDIEIFAYSFFLGYLLTILEYFLVVPFGLQRYSCYLSFIITIISAIVILICWKKKNQPKGKEDINGKRICIIFVIIMLFIECFTYAGRNLLPPAIDENILYNDCLYWIGNTIEASKEFPLRNFRNFPDAYNYHYFTSLQLAFINLVTGINITLLSFAFQYIQPIIMLVTGGYCLFSRLTEKTNIRILAMTALIFVSGNQAYTLVTYTHHMFVGQFAFDYGMGMFLFLFFLVVREFEKYTIAWQDWVIILICFSALCGIKASFAAVALAGIGLVCIYWLFSKRIKKAFIVGIPILASFIMLYMFVVNIEGYAGNLENEFTKQYIWEITNNAYLIKTREMIFTLPVPKLVSEILFYLIYSLACDPTVFLPVIYIIFQKKIHHEKLAKGSLILLGLVLMCTGLMLYVPMHGISQMYFVMAAYPLGIAFDVINAEIFRLKWEGLLIWVLMLIGINDWYHAYGSSIATFMWEGADNYFIQSDRKLDCSDRAYISKKQAEAFVWLSEVSEEDDIVTINRKKSSITGVFTECYVVNLDDTDLFFSTSEENIQSNAVRSMRDRDVSWIIFLKDNGKDFKLNTQECQEIFMNEEVVIYEILYS